MSLFTVTITDFAADRREHVTQVEAADADEARLRALHKLFGNRAWWFVDTGLGRDYGQVMETLPRRMGGSTSVTGRARITVYAED